MSESDFAIALAKRINVSLDVPFVDEATEQVWLERGAGAVATVTPIWLKPFLLSAADGIDDIWLAAFEDVLVAEANRRIDIKWIGESIEEQLLRPIVNAALRFASEGLSLDTPEAA